MAKKTSERKYTHAEVQDAVASYFMTAGRMRIVCKEMRSKLKEVPDIYGIDRLGTYMVEVKVTRKDFLADAKKTFRLRPKEGVGKWRYYACPAGVILESDLPPKWGLIYLHPDGKIEIVRGKRFNTRLDDNKYWFQPNYMLEYWAMYALLRKAVSWGIGSDGVWKYNKEDFMDKDEYDAIGETMPTDDAPPSNEVTDDDDTYDKYEDIVLDDE